MSDLSSLTPLANHLWQSTIFVGVIWLLTRAFKKNRAAVRYWLWFAASVKFLLPFSFLVALGSRLSWRSGAPVAQPQWSFVVDNAIQPFAASTAPPQVVSPHASFTFISILVAVWLCGATVGLVFWLKCWMQMRRIRKTATPLPLGLPIPVLSSPSQIEPGVFGIFRPVLLLPEGIESRLTPAQLDTIVAHEMAHVRRRDNLTAAIHMLVEIVFWFFPVVYWLRVCLIEERENACDEAVVSMGSEAESYAEGIIEICKFYAECPSTCISGISGSDLKKRISRIVNFRLGENLTRGKKAALALASLAVLIAPLVMGLLNAPLLRAQSPDTSADWEKAAGGKMSFDIASVKQDAASTPGMAHSNVPLGPQNSFTPTGGLFSATNESVFQYMIFAYKLSAVQLQPVLRNLPKWTTADRFDVEARASGNPTKDQYRLMMQNLLAVRFKLAVHYETVQIPQLALVFRKPGKFGPQLREHKDDVPCTTGNLGSNGAAATITGGFPLQCGIVKNLSATTSGHLRIGARGIKATTMANMLNQYHDTDKPIVDKTALGLVDFVLEFAPDEQTDGYYAAEPGEPTFLGALGDQLGLKLEPITAPADILVIDHIEEPMPN